MQNKKISLFFSVIIIISIISLINIQSVYATDYEWIENGDFEGTSVSSNANNGFESAILPYYSTGTPTRETTYAHTGTYSCFLSTSDLIGYNFNDELGENISVSTLTSFSFWLYRQSFYTGGSGTALRIYYENTSGYTQIACKPSVANTWTYFDKLANLNQSKKLYKISFEYYNTGQFIDDILIEWNGGSGGQNSTVSSNTTPFLCPYGGSAIIDDVLPANGTYSLHSVASATASSFWTLEYNFPIVVQSIPYLNVSTVSNFTLLGYNNGDDFSSGIRAFVWFSDNSIATQYISFSTNETWELFNFTELISTQTDKYIVSVGFVQDGTGDYVYIDDVSLISTTQRTVSSNYFSFTLTPTPLTYSFSVTGYGFHAYSGTPYTFTGYLSVIENGNFTVVANSKYMDSNTSGTVNSGVFSFLISARRTYLPYDETFLITTVLDSGTYTFFISAYWLQPAIEITTTETNTENNMAMIVNLLPYILIYGICVGGGALYLKFVGVIIGLNIAMFFMLILMVTMGYGNLVWVLPLTILMDIILIVFRPKEQPTQAME